MGFGIITPTTTSGIDMTLTFQQVLSLCGLVQTGDTGQWDGVSNPTNDSYLIYRFNDALSSTYPVYLKFMDYNNNNATSSNANLTMLQSVGFSTDGAGTITGSRTNYQRISSSGNSSYNFKRILYSYTNSGFYIALDYVNNHSPAFCVERALNQDGTISDSQGEIGCFNFTPNTNTVSSITHKPNGFKDSRGSYYPILGNNPYVTNTGLSTVMPYYFFGESRPWQSNLMSVGNKLANIGWNCVTNGTSKYYQQQASTHGSYLADYNFGFGHLPGMLWE